jgi:thiol-disulfide isomerase/thioredoxin
MKELKKLLKGSKPIVLIVFANWCGHCQRLKENVWNPMCSRKKVNADQVAAVESSVLEGDDEHGIMKNVSAFPTVLEVKNGRPVRTLPVPANAEELEKEVANLGNSRAVTTPATPSITAKNTYTPKAITSQTASYTPASIEAEDILTPMEQEELMMSTKPEAEEVPPIQLRGGGTLLQTLQGINSGLLPTSLLLKGGRKRRVARKTKKAKKSKKSKKSTRRH